MHNALVESSETPVKSWTTLLVLTSWHLWGCRVVSGVGGTTASQHLAWRRRLPPPGTPPAAACGRHARKRRGTSRRHLCPLRGLSPTGAFYMGLGPMVALVCVRIRQLRGPTMLPIVIPWICIDSYAWQESGTVLQLQSRTHHPQRVVAQFASIRGRPYRQPSPESLNSCSMWPHGVSSFFRMAAA